MTDTNGKPAKPRKNSIRILALIGVILLAALYGSTLVFALTKSPDTSNLFMASIACTILIPVLLYAYQLIYKLLKKKEDIPEAKQK